MFKYSIEMEEEIRNDWLDVDWQSQPKHLWRPVPSLLLDTFAPDLFLSDDAGERRAVEPGSVRRRTDAAARPSAQQSARQPDVLFARVVGVVDGQSRAQQHPASGAKAQPQEAASSDSEYRHNVQQKAGLPPPWPWLDDANDFAFVGQITCFFKTKIVINQRDIAFLKTNQIHLVVEEERFKRKTKNCVFWCVAKQQPDPVSVNPHLALISPAYPVGTMSSIGRASMAPTLPLVGQFQRTRSTCGSVHRLDNQIFLNANPATSSKPECICLTWRLSFCYTYPIAWTSSYGKRPAPPPPVNPPPALQVMETSEESAAESDAPIARPFHVPRPRSRASALVSFDRTTPDTLSTDSMVLRKKNLKPHNHKNPIRFILNNLNVNQSDNWRYNVVHSLKMLVLFLCTVL